MKGNLSLPMNVKDFANSKASYVFPRLGRTLAFFLGQRFSSRVNRRQYRNMLVVNSQANLEVTFFVSSNL